MTVATLARRIHRHLHPMLPTPTRLQALHRRSQALATRCGTPCPGDLPATVPADVLTDAELRLCAWAAVDRLRASRQLRGTEAAIVAAHMPWTARAALLDIIALDRSLP